MASKTPAVSIPQSDLVVEKDNDVTMPQAIFIENVEKFVGNRDIEAILSALQDLHSKYKYLESGLLTQKYSLKTKLPDIESALSMVRMLKKKADGASDPEETLETVYNISECLHVRAEVPLKNKTILLWLGASTLLEYTYEEAENILMDSKSKAVIQLVSINKDAVFIRDQIVTSEVNIARCHNWGVLKRQKAREAAKELENKEIKA